MRTIIVAFTFLIFLFGCGFANVENSLIIGFNADISEEQAREIISRHGISMKEFHNSVSTWTVVAVPAGDEEEWINILEEEENIKYAEINQIVHANGQN